MTRFEHVKEILDRAVQGQSVHAHGAFWRGLTRDLFVQKIVFGQQLLVVGDAANSTMIHALRGEMPFGADTGAAGANYRRMPAGRPPVPDADIAFIAQWINEGCLEDEYVPLPAPGAAPAMLHQANVSQHLAYWRDLDNWSLENRSPEVDAAISEMFQRAFLWHAWARNPAALPAWTASLQQGAAPGAWSLLADRQGQTVKGHYGTPVDWDAVLESYEAFGAGTFPPDPLRPGNPLHVMDGVDMWFYWAAFADGCIRLGINAGYWTSMQRALLAGALNDGLVRGRFAVQGFAPGIASQPQVLAYVKQVPDGVLTDELARRYVQSGLS